MSQKPPVLDDNTELQKTAERIVALSSHANWDLPQHRGKALTGDKLDGWIENKEDQVDVGRVELGFGYALKKRELGHGLFMAWVKETGRSQRAVQEAIQIAHMLVQLSDSNAGRASHLPQRKLKVLASAPPALIDDLFDNDELNEDMSREQMREIIRLETKLGDVSKKLDAEVLKNQELKEKLSDKQAGGRFPEYVETIRHESASVSYRIGLCVDDLERIFDELEDQRNSTRNPSEDALRDYRVAYSSLYHNLNGTVAKANLLLLHMREVLDEEITGPIVDHQAIFTEDEAMTAIKNRSLINLEHEHERLVRENQRKAGRPKKRGRPSKSGK